MRTLITHSLLYAWLYAIKENPYEDATTKADPMEDFMQVLRREPTETTDAMQRGIDFENLVTSIQYGWATDDIPKASAWKDAAAKVAEYTKGGILQVKVNKGLCVAGREVLLHGRLDCLKAGHIYDIKFSTGYDRGKYVASTQHPTYLELVPEALDFTYLVTNGTDVWSERYTREETQNVQQIISDFFSWLECFGLMPVYESKWAAQ